MELTVDPGSPVPPSHQIAEAIRYRIAVGELRPGDRLPSLRDAGAALDVHYLTVRKAYQALARDGLLESARGRGTWVADSPGPPSFDPTLRRFLSRVLREARDEHALGPRELADLLGGVAAEGRNHVVPNEPHLVPGDSEELDEASSGGRASDSGDPADDGVLHVVECSELQARDYADQLKARVPRPVRPWRLDGGEPPPGLIVGTYFHFNDIRERWPHRAADLVFVTVSLDPELAHRIDGAERSPDGPIRVRLCEVDASRMHSVLPELVQLLPEDRYRVEQLPVRRPADALASDDPAPVLFAPRLWSRLPDEERRDSRAHLLRYVIDPSSLESLQ